MPSKKPDPRAARLADIALVAVECEAEYSCVPELLVAQWAVESSWGTRTSGKNNYFGIKKAKRHKSGTITWTLEEIDGRIKSFHLSFADYDCLWECACDYAELVTTGAPYREAFERFAETDRRSDPESLKKYVEAVCSRYATSSDYFDLVWAIMQQGNVKRAVKDAYRSLSLGYVSKSREKAILEKETT